jgi:hypothetical protein
MLTILICVAQTFLSDPVSLAFELETQGVVLALAVFAFILCRLRLHSRPDAPESQNI